MEKRQQTSDSYEPGDAKRLYKIGQLYIYVYAYK